MVIASTAATRYLTYATPILCEWAVGKREIVLLDRENALGSEARL